MDRKYDPETYLTDAKEIRESNKINNEDREILAKYLLASRLNGKSLEGRTYQEILDLAKKNQEADAEYLRQIQEQKSKAKRLDALIDLKMISKNVVNKDGAMNINLTLNISNKKKKQVKEVIGIIILYDESNVEINSFDLDYETELPGLSTLNFNQLLPFSELIEGDKRLAQIPFEKIKFSWICDRVIYNDGAVMD